MNEPATVMIRWISAGDGDLKNTATLLIDLFGCCGIAEARLDACDGTIIALPGRSRVSPSQ